MGGSISTILGGEKAQPAKAAPGGQFEPFTYTGLSGTATGTKQGEGFNFSQELNPQLQALYLQGLGQSSPFLSQYLQQAQAPVSGFDYQGGDVREREQEIYNQNLSLLQPGFAQQNQQLQQDLYGSGRFGLNVSGEAVGAGRGTGMVNPDQYGLSLAQSRAIAELGPQARQLANEEQATSYAQQTGSYGLNQGAQQQQLANLLAGYQGALGTAESVQGMESGLIAQAAGLEQARSGATNNAYAAGPKATAGSGGLFGSILSGAAGPAGTALGGKAATWIAGLSDMRLKDNINKIGAVQGINIYNWDWSKKALELGAGIQATIGVMAQEVMKTIPEAVVMGNDGYYRVNYSKVFKADKENK